MKSNSASSVDSTSNSLVDPSRSPVRSLKPITESPITIDIESIEIDPTNPGSVTESLRYRRRSPSMLDSFDVLNRIVYPVIVCEHPEKKSKFKYMHIDGFGRIDTARARGQKKIEAIVFPPFNLEQRICLRQTLGAAQEPFDTASIIRDLQALATERGLDLSNPEHIDALVRDLPEKVRKHRKSLIMLARWHPDAVDSLGETYKKDGRAIGLDKIKEMDGILRVLEEKHSKIVSKLGGQREVSLKLAKMYQDKKFSEGSRSQDAIRKVRRTFDIATENDPDVLDFLVKEKPYSDLPKIHSPAPEKNTGELVNLCKQLTNLLLDVESDSLTPVARRALERTDAVLNEVLNHEQA